MRAMWIGTPTATQFGLGTEFFDRCPGHITPPGSVFIKNSEQLYGLWFFAINNFMEWRSQENGLQMGMPDENGFRTFQGRASFGALRTTSYWLTVILATLIETYIKDALTFVASFDPAIIQLPQDNLPSLSDAPPEGRPVSAILAREWARAWLRNRKEPAKWIEGFEQLGVNGELASVFRVPSAAR